MSQHPHDVYEIAIKNRPSKLNERLEEKNKRAFLRHFGWNLILPRITLSIFFRRFVHGCYDTCLPPSCNISHRSSKSRRLIMIKNAECTRGILIRPNITYNIIRCIMFYRRSKRSTMIINGWYTFYYTPTMLINSYCSQARHVTVIMFTEKRNLFPAFFIKLLN